MTTRIKELKQQAEAYVDSVDAGLKLDHYQQFVDLKFAELVLVEVYAYILNATLDDQPWPDFATVKRHFFGVDGMSTEDKKTLIKELLGVKNETN